MIYCFDTGESHSPQATEHVRGTKRRNSSVRCECVLRPHPRGV